MVVLSPPMTQNLSSVWTTCKRNKGDEWAPVFSCANGNWKQETNLGRRRKAVEHLCLLKAKKDLSGDEEKDILDYLYTSQYQIRGIVAVSLGQLSGQAKEDYTRAVFMCFQKAAINGPAEDALKSLQELTTEFRFLIVHCTQGSNFNISRKEYTHGVVMRFRSLEAFEIFLTSSGYGHVWKTKFQPIARKH